MSSRNEIQRISLYNREGGSDKVYTLWLEKSGNLYTVQAQWGRRGGPQQTGAKNSSPVSLEKARVIYEKTLKEKRAKGYHEGEDAPAYSMVEGAQDTGLRPMLLTDLSGEDPNRFLVDPNWGAQQKMNGKRIMIRTANGKVTGSNRRGLACPIPKSVENELLTTSGVIDGELIGDTYYAFDMLEAGHLDLRTNPYKNRVLVLENAIKAFKNIKVVPVATAEKDKRDLMEHLMATNQEGIVFKKLDAPYEPGRRENALKTIAVKVKFYAEVAAQIIDWTGKQSVEVGLASGKGLTSVGKVTVPTKYVDQVKKGELVRVKYLYATSADQLFQAHLDPDDSGSVIADHDKADPITALKHEGKEEE
jgi:bifunctional non-homologous end joining protein LigD